LELAVASRLAPSVLERRMELAAGTDPVEGSVQHVELDPSLEPRRELCMELAPGVEKAPSAQLGQHL